LRAWFEADPSQTGCDLLGRLQVAYPNRYGDALLRTVQRRLKVWRGEIASSLVFGVHPRTAQVPDACSGTST
jgi:hypothetical protein